MIGQVSLLVMLVNLVDRVPVPPPPAKRGRRRPKVYADRLFLKALVSMIVRHLHTVHELLTVLDQLTPELQLLRTLLTEQGKFPYRRTWERRLAALPDTLPAHIGCLGQHLATLISRRQTVAGQWPSIVRCCGHVAGSGIKRIGQAGAVPHTSIDTEAHWTKSGWHGWVHGWKLHIVATVAKVGSRWQRN